MIWKFQKFHLCCLLYICISETVFSFISCHSNRTTLSTSSTSYSSKTCAHEARIYFKNSNPFFFFLFFTNFERYTTKESNKLSGIIIVAQRLNVLTEYEIPQSGRWNKFERAAWLKGNADGKHIVRSQEAAAKPFHDPTTVQSWIFSSHVVLRKQLPCAF